MRVTGGDGDDALDERFEFWHAPCGLWRIESDGEVVYVASATGDVLVRIDGQMQRQGRGDVSMVWLGPTFSPLDLLGLDALLRRMSTGMSVSTPAGTDVDGRRAWTVTLTARSGESVELAFDDATGVLVQLSSVAQSGRLAVSDLVEHDRLGDELFTWDGPVVDAPAQSR